MTTGRRLYITGASCSGVTTLGSLLAEALNLPQFDVDDFYWLPTDPPFTAKRPPEDRVQLILDRQEDFPGWILTGSCVGWGDRLIRDADLIIFLNIPTIIRLERLDQREASRHGLRILPGGDMYENHIAFRDWASRYDDPSFKGRNRAQHEAWLTEQTAPVLRLNGTGSGPELAQSVLSRLSGS